VGTVSGTVEDVGIRSTRIRTNDRTLVTIPNGDFASRQIENYATRDRFLFNPTIGIAYGQSAAKVRRAVEIVRETLLGHEGIIHEGLRATLTNMGDSALTIEVWSYLAGPDYGNAMQVRQDVLLTVMERFEAEQITLAQPTSPVVVVQDGTLAPT
jgi:MscS family membrane protein